MARLSATEVRPVYRPAIDRFESAPLLIQTLPAIVLFESIASPRHSRAGKGPIQFVRSRPIDSRESLTVRTGPLWLPFGLPTTDVIGL